MQVMRKIAVVGRPGWSPVTWWTCSRPGDATSSRCRVPAVVPSLWQGTRTIHRFLALACSCLLALSRRGKFTSQEPSSEFIPTVFWRRVERSSERRCALERPVPALDLQCPGASAWTGC